MFTLLSLVTSIKDYVEIVHKFIETDPSFEFKTYYDFGSIFTFVVLSGKDLNEKKSIYLLFTITHSHYTKVININLKMFHPDLYRDIRKAFFPSPLDKIKKFLGIQ